MNSDKKLFEPDSHFSPLQAEENEWATPWADLMMTMFIFFAVLFLTKTLATSSEGNFKSLPEQTTRTELVAEAVLDHVVQTNRYESYSAQTESLSSDGLSHFAQAIAASPAKEFQLNGKIMFGRASSSLESSILGTMDSLGRLIKSNNLQVIITGHASKKETKDKTDPWQLSTDRARAVASYFIEKDFLTPSRITICGRGTQAPLVPSTSTSRQARNQRVEITLLKN